MYLARELQSKFVVAIKTISKKELKKCGIEKDIELGISLHDSLEHENILHLYGRFEDEKRIYLIMDYCPRGDMYGCLLKHKRFSKRRAASYIRKITAAIDYCHQMHVIHRDIKPENILLGPNVFLYDYTMIV